VSELVVDGAVAFRVGREGDELVAEWTDLCVLRCDRTGHNARFVAMEGTDPRVIAKVKGGLVAALLRHLDGGTTLHASAVSRGGDAIAFLGRSGAGKSTLAAWLSRTAGFDLLADDVVRVEVAERRAIAHPTEVEHWLEPASLRALGLAANEDDAKMPLAALHVARAPSALLAVVFLSLDDDAKAPRLTRVHGHRALEQLVPCLVRFVLDEPLVQIGELDRMASLLEAVPFYQLHTPRKFDALRGTAHVVEELFSQRDSQ
jgi:hypothetical protein